MMIDKIIEQAWLILEQFRTLDEIDATSYQAGINQKRNLEDTLNKLLNLSLPKPCPECKGIGVHLTKHYGCSTCKGTGEVSRTVKQLAEEYLEV